MSITRKFMRKWKRIQSDTPSDQAELARRVVGAVTAMGFVMTPLADADAAIEKVSGEKFLNGNNTAHIYADAVLDAEVALNTFKEFKVNADQIANLYFKEAGGSVWAENLVNIVGSRIDINGAVNAIKNNNIGGNLFFLSKDGMAVGAGGVINAGSLTVMTPTSEYLVKAGLANWGDGVAEDTANGAIDLINWFGTGIDPVKVTAFQKAFLTTNWGEIKRLDVPINKLGTITVSGKINTTDGIVMKAAHINIDKDATASQLGTAVLQSGITDFSSLVNTSEIEGYDSNVVISQTASGDIVLSAEAHTANATDEGFADKVITGNVEGYNTVKADVTVGTGAKIIASGDISITAEATNGTHQAGLFSGDLAGLSADALFGNMAKTVAEVNVDGTVTANTVDLPVADENGNQTIETVGGNVDIHANTRNVYIAESLTNPVQIVSQTIKDMIPTDSDVSLVVMDSEANVTIGEHAVITAKSERKDDFTVEEGWEAGGIEFIEGEEHRNYALNISAESEIEASAGAGAAAVKLQRLIPLTDPSNDLGQLVPNAGVVYLEVDNEANVTVAGKLDSKGDTNIGAAALLEAEAVSAADAPTRQTNQDVNNFANAAVTIADIENRANTIVTGQDKTAEGLMNIAAVTESGISTQAMVNAGELSIANTAINITDIVTDASVTVDAHVRGADVEVNAENTIDNEFVANNKIGLSKMASKFANARLTAVNSLLGMVGGRIRTPHGLEKMGEFITIGASVGVLDETNHASVNVTERSNITAQDASGNGGNLTVKADMIVEDTHVNVAGATNNYYQNANQSVLINSAVLVSDIKSDASVVIEGGSDAEYAELIGKNVDIHANSAFVYDRIGGMWADLQELLGEIKDAYGHSQEVLEAVDALLSTEGAEEYMADPTSAKATAFFDKLSALADLVNQTPADAADGVASLIEVPSAIFAFVNGQNYANFYVSSFTGGKETTSGGTGGQSAKAAVAGAVNINDLANEAQVVIGKNTIINADGAVDIGASALQEDVTFNGTVKLIIPKMTSIGGGELAVGGNVGYHTGAANSTVVVAEDADITGNSIDIAADNEVMHIAATFGGGEAGNTGVTGMGAYMSGESDSIVVVDDDAKLTATAKSFAVEDFVDNTIEDETKREEAAQEAYAAAAAKNGAVTITADNDTNIQNIILDKTSGTNTAVGASVGIVDYDINNIAAIADNADGADGALSGMVSEKLEDDIEAHLGSDEEDDGEVRANKLTVDASTTGIIDTITVAGVTSGGDNTGGHGSGSIGIPAKIGVAGSVSYNQIDGTTGAYVDNTTVNIEAAGTGVPTTDGQQVSVGADDDMMIGAYSGTAAVKKGGAAGGSGLSATLAGAVAMNETNKSVIAQIKDAEINNANAITNTAVKGGADVAAGLALGKESAGTAGAGLAGLGASASVNEITNIVHATIENTDINKTATNEATQLSNIAKSNDIQIAGGVNAQYAKANLALGAAVSQMTATNDIQATISGGTMNQMGTVSNYAVSDLIQVGAAVSAGIIGGQNYLGVEGAFVENDLTNHIGATIDGATITASSVDIKAYDGTLGENKHHDTLAVDFDVDGAEALADVNAGDGDVSVVESNLGNADAGSEGKEAYSGTDFTANENGGNLIVTSAAALALNTGNGSASVTAGAAISENTINNSFNAGIKGSTITTTGSTSAQAESDTLVVGVAAGASASTTQQGFAGAASASTISLSNDTVAAIENSSVTANTTAVDAKTKSRLINAAGQVSATKGNVAAGAAVAINDLNNKTGAYVRGADITSDKVRVSADNESKNYAIGAGVVASANEQGAALNGSVAINKGTNDTEAVVEAYDNNGTERDNTLTGVSDIDVTSSDETVLKAIAGNVTFTKANAGIGGTVAYNEIGTNGKQNNIARLDDATITAEADSAINVSALDTSDILTIAAGGSANTSQQSGVAQGSVAIAKANKNTEASMSGTNINEGSKAQNANVSVLADSNTSMTTSADVLSVGMGYAVMGAGVAVTTSDADTKAIVDGGTHYVKSELVQAKSDNDITNIGIGAAVTAGQGASLAGNVAVNNITNDTEASVKNASINASGSVGVIASSREHLENYAGALSATLGKGYVAAGASVAVNSISGNTSALVDNSDIIAQGSGDGINNMTGLVVSADGDHELDNIVITAGIAATSTGTGALSGTVAVNTMEGATTAEVRGSDINDTTETLSTNADVNVSANDTTDISSHVGSAAIAAAGQGAAAIGEAADSTKLSRDVKAQIVGKTTGNTVNADQLNVTAHNAHDVMTTASGLSFAAGMYGTGSIAGTVSVLNIDNMTVAGIENMNGNNSGTSVLAEQDNNVSLYGNSAALGGSLGGGAVGAGVLVVNDDSETNAVLKNAGITHNAGSDSDDSIRAVSDMNIKTELANAVASISIGAGVGGVVGVTNINNTVQTDIIGATVTGGDAFSAKAENNITADYDAGVGAGGMVAVGVGVNVNNINSAAVTNVTDSNIDANTVTLLADENRNISQTAVSATLGGISVPVNVLVTSIGAGVADTYGGAYAETQNIDDPTSDVPSEQVSTNTAIDISGSIKQADTSVQNQNALLHKDITGGAVSGTDSSSVLGSSLSSISGAGDITADSGLTAEGMQSGLTQSVYTPSASQAKGVKVNVSGGTINAGQVDIKADATTNTDIGMISGDLALASVGSTVGVLNVDRDSAVNITGATITSTGALNINTNQDGTAELNAYQGAINGASVNVTVTSGSLTGKNDINVSGSQLTAANALDITATDTAKLKLETIGAALSVANAGILVADANNTSTSTLTVTDSALTSENDDVRVLAHHGVSDALMAEAQRIYDTSLAGNTALQIARDMYEDAQEAYNKTTGDKLDAATNLESARMALEEAEADAKRTAEEAKINYLTDKQNAELINVNVIPVAAGLAASGLVVSATLDDNSTAAANIGTGNTFTAGGDVNIGATNNSVNEISSVATAASIGAAVGVTGVDIDANAKSHVTVGDGNTFTAGGGTNDVNIEATAHAVNKADMIAVGGAGIAAFAVNWADVTARTDVNVNVGANTYHADELNINGESIVDQYARATGVVAGIATSGTNFAKVHAYDNVQVTADGMNGGTVNTANVTANGEVNQVASSNGYGGALLDISPVASMIKSDIDSDSTATIGGTWIVGGMNVSALHDNYVDLDNDAVKASVVGLSGVYSYNDIKNNTQATFSDADITATGDVKVDAVNDIDYRNRVWGGGYGVIEAAGVLSYDDISMGTAVTFTDSDVRTTGGIEVNALTGRGFDADTQKPNATIDKEVTIKSAGVAAGTLAVSDDEIELTNSINIGAGSALTTSGVSDKNSDIKLTAADRINIVDEATADTQGGVVGASSTDVSADITHNNTITVAGTIDSNYDVNIDAGDSSTMNVTLKSNAYNKTAAPLITLPLLDEAIHQTNTVKVSEGGVITTGRNINIAADTGDTTVVTQSQSWKWTDGGLTGTSSIASTTGGTGDKIGTTNNSVTIDGTLTAGKNNVLDITIDGVKGVPTTTENQNADTNKDGIITLDEAIIYANDAQAVADKKKALNDAQTAYDAVVDSAQAVYDALTAKQADRGALSALETAEKAAEEALSTAESNARTQWESLSVAERLNYNNSVEQYVTAQTGAEQTALTEAKRAVTEKLTELKVESGEVLDGQITVLEAQLAEFKNEKIPVAQTAVNDARAEYEAVADGVTIEDVNKGIFGSDGGGYVTVTASDWYTKQYGSPMAEIGLKDYSYHLTEHLVSLSNMVQEYGGTDAGDAYAAQLARVQSELVALGLGCVETDADGRQTFVLYDGKSTVPTVMLDNISVSGGDIMINSGRLQGSGTITANGNPQVTITNNSNFYLNVQDIGIDGAGGEVKYNGVSLNKDVDRIDVNTSPGKLNGNASITISGMTPLKASESQLYTPDIGIFGTIYNPYGKVTVSNAHNSIYIKGEGTDGSKGGSIKAREVTITAGGSVTQGYQDSIVNISGNPHDAVDDYYIDAIQAALVDQIENLTAAGQYYTAFTSVDQLAAFIKNYVKDKDGSALTDETAKEIALALAGQNDNAENGIYAAGAIYINAANINVNGTIQSGFDTYQLNVDNSRMQTVLTQTYDSNQKDDAFYMNPEWLVTGGTGGADFVETTDTDGNVTGKYVYNMQAWYNPVTNQIFTEDIDQSGGGRIYLTGAIANTSKGGGQLIALDGGANFTINSNVAAIDDYKLKIGSINADNVHGIISITDTNKKDSSGNAITTVYTRDTSETNNTYTPLAGQVYDWTTGESSRVTTSYKHVYDSDWFGLDKDEWEDQINQMDEVEKQNLAIDIETAEGDPTTPGDVIHTSGVTSEYEYLDVEGSTNSTSDDLLYTIKIERVGEPKQGKDENGNLLYLDANDNLTTDEFAEDGTTHKPYYLTVTDEDGNVSYVYETVISDKVTTTEKKGLFGLWGSTVTTTWKETKGMLTAYDFGLKADNAIGVSFIGNERSTVTINGNAASVIFGGDVRAGSVDVTNRGNIETAGFGTLDHTTIYSDNIIANAGGNISLAQRGVDNALTFNATAGGDIKLDAMAGKNTGDVQLGSVTSTNGIVNIDAEGSVLAGASQTTYQLRAASTSSPNITAKGIIVNAAGGVGAADNRLVVATSGGAVDVNAQDNVYLQNGGSGAMYLGEIVSSGGNVDIVSDGGFVDAIVDNTVVSETDAARIADWKRLGLLGTPADDRMMNDLDTQNDNLKLQVQSVLGADTEEVKVSEIFTTAGNELVTAVSDEYQAFVDAQVEMIKKQTALNNAIAALGRAKNSADTSDDAGALNAYNDALTAYNDAYGTYAQQQNIYQQAKDAWIADYVAAQHYPTYEHDTEGVGGSISNKMSGLLSAYESLNHQAVVTDANGEPISGQKYGWTQRQLLYAVQDSIINPSAGSISDVKTANITANNIVLTSANGDFGVVDTQKTTIKVADMFDENNTAIESDLQKLASARADDVTWGNEYITVERTIPISITLNKGTDGKADGTVTLTAPNAENVYLIGKDSVLNIDEVIASGDVRLLAHEGIYGKEINADGTTSPTSPTVIGSSITLEGGRGDIGSADYDVLVGLLSGGKINANAAGDIYLTQLTDSSVAGLNTDMVLGSIAGDNINITATGNVVSGSDKVESDGVVEFSNVSYINAGETLNITTQGGVGTAEEGLRVKNSGATVNIAAEGNVYLEAKQDGTLILGNITDTQGDKMQGDLIVTSEGSVQLGNVDDTATADQDESATIKADDQTVSVTAAKDIIFGGHVEADDIFAQSYAGDIEQTTTEAADNIVTNHLTASAVQGAIRLTNQNNVIGSADDAVSDITILALGTDMDIDVTQSEFDINLGNITNNFGGDVEITNHGGTMNVSTTVTEVVDGEIEEVAANTNIYGDIKLEAEGTVTITDEANLYTNKLIEEGTNTNEALLADSGNITVISNTAGIVNNGVLDANAAAGGTATVTLTAATNVETDNSISAQTDVIVTAKGGDVSADGTVSAGNDVNVNATNGSAAVSGTVNAGSDASVTATDNVTVSGTVDAAAGDASITAGTDALVSGTVSAGNDASIIAGTDALVSGTVEAGSNASINAGNDIAVTGTTTADSGDISLTAGNDAALAGTATAGNDITVDAVVDATVEGTATAGNNIAVDAGNDATINAAVNAGNDITVNAIVDATVEGTATAGSDVSITAGEDALVKATVDAGGNVTVDAAVDTAVSGAITADEDILLTADSGSLTVDNTVTSTGGSITLQTTNEDSDSDITINAPLTTQSQDDSGNITVTTQNGSISINDDITVEGSGLLNIDVTQSGTITTPRNDRDAAQPEVTLQSVNGSVDIHSANGDIDLYEVLANDTASVIADNGNVSIHMIDGNIVILKTKAEGTTLDVDKAVIGDQLQVNSYDANIDLIEQRNGVDERPTIDLAAGDPTKPMNSVDLGLGDMPNGAEITTLWANNASVTMESGELFIPKMAIIDKADFNVNGMTTTVYGTPPVRGDSNSTYWYNVEKYDPSNDLSGWYDRSVQGDWMYLNFAADGRTQYSNGVLLELDNYYYVYDQRFTGVDHLNERLAHTAHEILSRYSYPSVSYYWRYALYELPRYELANTRSRDIVVENI